MKKFLQLSFLFSFLLISFKGKSSHFAGGDLTYNCIGNNTYIVTLTMYRDCSGVPLTIPILNFRCSSNTSYNFTSTMSLVAGSVHELTQACTQNPTSCSGGNNYGIEEYVYQTQVVLPPCNQWIIDHVGNGRNNVTTVYQASSNNYYIYAELNNLNAPCNNSPTFIEKPALILPMNQLLTINSGALDMDGDSLVYYFYPPVSGNGFNGVTYYSPYSHTNFLLSSIPITLNINTGIINCNPILALTTLTGIFIIEYRKINNVPTQIGRIYRDLQFKVIPESNIPPKLSGINYQNTHIYNPYDTIFYTQSCANQPIEFNIIGFDADTIDTNNLGHKENFAITWNNGIQNANFQSFYNGTDSAYAHFNWTPTNNDTLKTKHCFTAYIHDYNCTYFGTSQKEYCIKIKPSPILNTQIDDTLIHLPDSLTLHTSFFDSIVWKNSLGTIISTNQSATFTQTGTYTLIVSNGICFDSDTFNVTFNLGFNESSKNLISLSQNYPNPAKDYTLIDVELAEASNTSIQITDICGRKILEKDFGKIPDGKSTLEIPLEGIAPGLYFYSLVIGNERISKKMVVE